MENLFEASFASMFASISIGIIIALLVVKKWQFPKNNILFALTIILNAVSPFIGQSSYLLGFSDGTAGESSAGFWTSVPSGSLEGIIVAYLLMSFFLVLNITYILKIYKIMPTVLAKN